MTTEQVIGLCIALFIMLIGVVGCLLPILPGTPIVWAAAVVHRLYFGDTGPSTLVLIILTLLTLISLIFDQAASVLGAKKLGATWKGVTGAVVGGLVGLFFGLPGIFLGPFIGATVFELFGDREFRDALRAGVGATLGLLFGAVGKVTVSIVMILMFSWSVVSRSIEANRAERETAPQPAQQMAPVGNALAVRSRAGAKAILSLSPPTTRHGWPGLRLSRSDSVESRINTHQHPSGPGIMVFHRGVQLCATLAAAQPRCVNPWSVVPPPESF